jgi:hypothetical protein
MCKSWRVVWVLFATAIAAAGCDKSGTTGAKPADETYAKKLVGVWEIMDEEMKSAKGEAMTAEFKADGGFQIMMGAQQFATGTWKLVKEEGKTVTVEADIADPFAEPGKGPVKHQTKTFSIVFEDANTAVMSEGGKPRPGKIKRKS